MDVAHYHYYNFAICLEPYQNIQKTSRVKTMKLQAAYGPLQFDPKNHHPPDSSAKLETPHFFVDIGWFFFFTSATHSFWGNQILQMMVVSSICFEIISNPKSWGFRWFILPQFDDLQIGAYVFLQIELVETQPPRICWSAMSRSHKELNLKTNRPRSCNRPTWSWACSRMEADRPVGKKRHVFFSDGVF